MPKAIPEEERETEDQMARRELGPRGEPGKPDPARMTPQARKSCLNAATLTGTRLEPLVRIAGYETGRASSAASVA
jgi:hypothetical protein